VWDRELLRTRRVQVNDGGVIGESCNVFMSEGCLGSMGVTVVGQTTCGEMDRQQLDSSEDWFKVDLATSVKMENNDQEGRHLYPL
jgi:hypothetical protein